MLLEILYLTLLVRGEVKDLNPTSLLLIFLRFEFNKHIHIYQYMDNIPTSENALC